jgi:L-amino acid N-acyltransferase YncA
MPQSNTAEPGLRPSLRFDAATEEDLPEILEIYNHAILNTTSQWDYRPHTLERRTEWFRATQRDGYPVIVVREDADPSRRILGWGSLGTFHAKEGYRFTVEDSIYVGDGCQGRGVGKALLKELIRKAREMGMKTMIAEIEAEHVISIKMHIKEGFVEAGRLPNAGYKFDRWLDLVILQLML